MNRFLLVWTNMALVGLIAIHGCSASPSVRSADPPPPAGYVVFGSWVLCASMDAQCLEERFNRCLGQTRKQHIRDNGRPQKLTLLTTGEAIAEWELRASGDRVIITYDHQGMAREWSYEGSWGALHGASFRVDPAGQPN